jgi:purine nucleosidase
MAFTPLFVESDMFGDVDDIGALALALELQARGRCRLLGIGINTPSVWGPRAAAVVIREFGADVPVGVLPGRATDDVFSPDYARLIGSQHTATDPFVEAPGLLADVLRTADVPVTVVSIGFFPNLLALLDLPGGVELVRAKVGRCLVMGGRFPEGDEFNISSFPAETAEFLARWPTAIDFVGFEAGADLLTGKHFSEQLGADDPVRVAYEAYAGVDAGRSSWDPLTVYLAAHADSELVSWSDPGELVMHGETGRWRADPAGRHRYAIVVAPAAEVEGILDELIVGHASRVVDLTP